MCERASKLSIEYSGGGGEPFKGGAFEGGRKGFVKDCVMGSVKGDVGDVDFEVFVGVGFTSVTL